MLIHHFTQFYAQAYPDNPCLSLGDKQITYSEFEAQVNQLANAMLSLDILPGQRIAILGENDIEHAVCFFAASKVGAVTVPLNYRLVPMELAYVINDAEAKILFVLDSALAQLAPLRENLSTGIHMVILSSQYRLGWHMYRTDVPYWRCWLSCERADQRPARHRLRNL